MDLRVSSYLLFVGAFVGGIHASTALSIAGGMPATLLRVVAVIGMIWAGREWLLGEDGDRPASGRALLGGILLAIALGPIAETPVAETPVAETPQPRVGGDLRKEIGESRMRGVLRGRVVSGPEPLRRGWGLTVAVDSIDETPYPDRPQVRLFSPHDRLGDGVPPLPGDVLEVFTRLERYPGRRFPGTTSDRQRMARRGIAARGIARDDLEVVDRRLGFRTHLDRRLAALRVAFVGELFARMDPRSARYAAAMTAGARGLLLPEQRDPFRHTGTSHLLAISGLHLGILAGLLWWLFGTIAGLFPSLLRRWGRRRVCALPVVATLALYVWGIGAPVSATRSLLMVVAVVVAVAVVRPVDSLHGLATAALVLLALQPSRLAELGFQLSFSATGAILWFLQRMPPQLEPPIDRRGESSVLHRWGRRIGQGIGVSLSATLATFPVLLAWHGWIPVDAIWVNLVLSPLVAMTIVPTLFFGAALALVAPAAGAPLLELGGAAMVYLATCLRAVDRLPPGAFVLGQVGTVATWLLGGGVFLWIGSRLRPRPLGIGALVIGLTVGGHWAAQERSSALRVHFIPVGQGDATLLEFPDGRTMLVDAGGSAFGGDPGRQTVVPYLRRQGIGELDWIVATHGDIDHVGGIPAVAERAEPDRFLFDPQLSSNRSSVVEHLRRSGARLVPVRERRDLRAGGAEISVIRPGVSTARSDAWSDAWSDNNRSLVTTVSYAGRSLVLPGDLEEGGERWLLARGARPTDLLKVPHHGSKTSSSPAFLDAMRPDVAVVSAGRFNPFGHPHSEVVDRYRRREIPLYRTSESGLVRARFGREGRFEVRILGDRH